MSDGARMDDILGQALAKAEITSAGPIKIQPRPAPANVGHLTGSGHHITTNHHQSPLHAQKVVISRSRNGPNNDIGNFKSNTPTPGQNIIVVRNGQQVKNLQGQTILISSPSGGPVRQGRVTHDPSADQNLTPVRQIRQNNIIRIDNSQLTPGSTVQFVKNGQLHTATSAPGNHGQISHQLHQVTTPGGVPSARRILPQAQISNHTSPSTPVVRHQPPQQVVHRQPQHVNNAQRVVPGQPPVPQKGNTLRLVTVDRSKVRTSISGVQVAKIKLPGGQSSASPNAIQRFSGSPNSSIRQNTQTRLIQSSPSPRPPVQAPARVSVQCHEPMGSKPGFIVLSSDSIENLRNTYTQLQRCFSTCIHDILDMDDKEHALMPKLKDIYRKSDTNYRNYLSKNPLKILDNVKAIFDGSFVPLEVYLKNESSQNSSGVSSSSGNIIPYIRVSSPKVSNAPQNAPSDGGNSRVGGSGPIRTMLAKPSPIARRPIKNASTQNAENIKIENAVENTNGSRHGHQVDESEIRIEPKIERKPTKITRRIDKDQLDVTEMINITDPFTSLSDIRSRLMPFNVFSYPEISTSDDSQSERVVLTPLCGSILTRKRKLEQRFRAKFNSYTSELTAGEDVLISEFVLESERAALEADRAAHAETQRKLARLRAEEAQCRLGVKNNVSSCNNNHNYTVHQSEIIDDESEHDNAVKGLLENF